MLFSRNQRFIRRKAAFGGAQLFLFLHQFFHLLQEIMFYLGNFMDFLYGSSFSQGLVDDKITLTGWGNQQLQQLFFGFFIKIFGMSQTVPSGFQASDCFLEGFFKSLSNTHDLSHRAHLSAQLVLHPFEFFKGPAGKFNYHVISVRHIFVQCTVFSAGNICKGQPGGKHCRHQGNGESGGFGSQCGGAGSPWIDFDDDIPIGLGIVRPLYVGAADHLDGFYDFVGFLLQPFLHFF